MTFFSVAGLAVSAVGVGMSAAGAAGAFNKKVDASGPTPEELQAAEYNKQIFEQGQAFQKALDPIYLKRLNAGRKNLLELQGELGKINQPGRFQQAANQSVNQTWSGSTDAGQGLAQRGGVGSGAFFARMGAQGNAMDAAVKSANVGGRLGYLDKLGQRRGQLQQQTASQLAATQGLYGDYSNRMATGLDLMNQGAGQAAQAQQNRIDSQVRDNMARNQAMGQLGGSLTSIGMMGMNFGGGLSGAGGAPGAAGPTAAGSAYQYLYGNGAMPSSIGGIRLS